MTYEKIENYFKKFKGINPSDTNHGLHISINSQNIADSFQKQSIIISPQDWDSFFRYFPKISKSNQYSIVFSKPNLHSAGGYQTIPLEFFNPNIFKISNLIFRNIEFVEIPEDLLVENDTIKAIKFLHCKITNISSLFSLENLRSFTFMGYQLGSIPKGHFQESKLESLKLSYLGLKAIPQFINGLKKLSLLDLSHNKISFIHSFLVNHKNLKDLDLSHNKIHSIPQSLFLSRTMTYLNLSFNLIQSIPPAPPKSETSLRCVRIKMNPLQHFPSWFAANNIDWDFEGCWPQWDRSTSLLTLIRDWKSDGLIHSIINDTSLRAEDKYQPIDQLISAKKEVIQSTFNIANKTKREFLELIENKNK